MKERPILFSGDMVRAILDGRKTQTRRVVKPQPKNKIYHLEPFGGITFNPGMWTDNEMFYQSKYGISGDRLWVREAWRVARIYNDRPPRDVPSGASIWYESEGDAPYYFDDGRYRHARFMPRWASRILLEITDVRVERVQEITRADAIAEGCVQRHDNGGWFSPEVEFVELWDSINAAIGFGWDANPWVWVISFRRVTP